MSSKHLDMERKLKSSFILFLIAIWRHLNLPKPTDIQKDIAKALQTGDKRLIIEAFRGVGKSYITSAFVVWQLYRNKELKIMVVSASKERALAFSHFTKRLIAEVPFLQHMQPTAEQRNSAEVFDVGGCKSDHSPSIKSVGITGQLTGSRADIIIADDVEVANNSATQTARDKLAQSVTEFDAILKPLPTSRVIYLGTPQCEMSLYNTLSDERGYTCRIWPALYPTEKEIIQYKGKLAPYILERVTEANRGLTTDPQRFSDEDLAERRMSYGKAGFSLQFMLNTSLSDSEKYPLKCSDLVVMDVPRNRSPVELEWGSSYDEVIQDLPCVGMTGDRFHRPFWTAKDEMQAYTGKVLAIDPSGRGKDETGYAVGFMLNGNIFVPEAGGLSGGYEDETLIKLCHIAKKHKVNTIIIESNFGDGMFTKLLQAHLMRIYPVMCEEVRVSGMKEQRIIDTLEPVMMQHRLIVDRKVISLDLEVAEIDPKYSLFYQLTRVTAERGALKHDDRLDALALMVSYWTDQMAASDKLKADKWREAALEEELKNFCIGVGTGFNNPSTWMDSQHNFYGETW